MFKSKEVNESQFLNNVTLPRLNDTCNGKPQITSTPINSLDLRRKSVLSPPPAIARHASPRKYSLSEVGAPSTRTNPKPTTPNAAPGPLLASLSIKDNVSMYQETKSSGLARRIVQYKEKKDKKNEKHYTHQEQYGSPGLFPIVHLFRKKLPVRKLKPERIMPRLSSPDYLKSLSPMINKNLDRSHQLDDQARSRYPRQSSFPAYSQNGVETKSVLEALKEISRKRIRSSEEYETIDTGKKAKTDSCNGVATSKRTRMDSPPLNSSSSPSLQQSQKKFCNEFDASKSSSDFTMLKKNETPKSSKRKTASTSTESLDNTKQVKVVAVETQTPITLLNVVEPKEKSPEIVEENVDKELPAIEKPKAKLVFNDVFMDNYRGKRLSSLMGFAFKKNVSVNGSEPEKPATVTTEQTEVQSHLTSILSSPKSSTHKPSEKHVHFTETTTAAPLISQPSLTQTSAPTLTPIVSESVSKSPIIQQKQDSITTPVVSTTPTFSFGNPTSTDKTDTSKPSFGKPLETSSSPQKLGGFKFDLASTTSPATKTTLSSISFPVATSANTLSFNKPSESSVIVFGSSSNTTTAASTTSKTEPTFSFGNSLAKSPAINFGSNTSETKAPSFNITTTPSTAPSFGITSTTTTSAAPLINFGSSSGFTAPATTTTTPSINFGGTFGGQSTASSKPSTAPPSMFGSNTTTVTSGFAPSATVTPTFGSPKASAGFGSDNVFGGGNGAPTFGNSTTTSAPAFGNTTAISTPTFGNTTTISAPAFGNTTAISASTFGNTTTISAPTFGNTTSVSAPAFGYTTTISAPTFGNTTTISAPSFGNTTTISAPTFGNATNVSAPTFGNTTTISAPTFGNTTTVSATAFGNTTSVFGTAPVTSTPVFGSGTTTATAPPTFGNNTSSVFGAPATAASVFGATSSPAPPTFGSTTSVFGTTAATPAPMFGSATTTTSASMFGSINTTTSAPPTFGSTASGFGSTPATSSSVFSRLGTKPTPAFGGTQTTAAPVFGAANSNPTFGSKNNVFGASTQAPPPAYGTPTFGQPQTAFGTTTTGNGLFGGTTTTTSATGFGATSTFSFGANKPATANPFGTTTTTSNSTFGTANAFGATTKSPSTFGAPSANTNAFSSTGGGFGASAPTFGGAPSTFGGTTAPVFGQKDNKAPFSFGGGENKTNTISFGSSTANSAFSKPNTQTGFGSTATSGFGTATAAQPQSNGGFNFGSNTTAAPFAFGGATTGTSTPAKPTFNFGGSTNPAPAFGTPNSMPTFGTASPGFAAPGAPTFSATGTPGAGAGVFNIGAGSTGGRPRTQLRAKRRT